MSRYLKAIIATVGAVAVVLQSIYPSWVWLPAVTAGVTAAGVYLIPNTSMSTRKGPS